MTDQKLLEELKNFLEERISMINLQGKTLGLGGTCFTISKLACKILRKLGYNCFVQRIYVIVGNRIGSKMFLKQVEEGKFDKEEITKAGGWTIGIGAIDTETKRNDFHYVVIFPDEKEIMDLTFEQANRPDKGIKAEPYWCSEIELPECIIKMDFIKEEIDSVPLYYLDKLKEWREETISLGYKKLKGFKK